VLGILWLAQPLLADNFSYDDLDPEVQDLYREAVSAKKNNREAEAIEKYNQLILILPRAEVFKQDLTDIYVKLKNWKLAEKYSKDLLTIDPQNKNYQLQVARILLWSKKAKLSFSELESLLLADPKDVPAMTELAQIYLNNKEEDKAQNVFRKILQVKPDQDSVKMDLAYSYLRQKKNDDALEVLKTVRRSSEFYGPAAKEISAIYLNKKDYKNSKEALQKAYQTYPGDLNLLEQLANVTLWLKEYDNAQIYFNQLKNRWPSRKKDWEVNLKELESQRRYEQLAKSPGVEWFSSFYSEALAGSTPRAVNLTSILSYRWPLSDSFRIYLDSGLRSDQAVGVSPIIGTGINWSFLSNASVTLRTRIEPDKGINISNWNAASLYWSPLSNMDLEFDYELTNYHDQNQSKLNSARLGWREVLLKPLKVNLESNDYQINQPSAYFVRIDKPGIPQRLHANQISAEYELKITGNFTLSPGYGYREEIGQSTAHSLFLKSHWLHQNTQYDGSVYYREDSLGYRYWFGYLAVNFIF
jgi:tetratricopeptide (TPR) repeat protein